MEVTSFEHSIASAVVKSMKAHARKPADMYPTPPAATQAVIDALADVLWPGAFIGEPACGEGDMARVLRANGFEVLAADLRHTGYGMGGYNYLEGGTDPLEGSLGWFAEYGLLDAIITNPPFYLAADFIRKAVQQAPVVAMLLKSNYWHAGKRLEKLFDECPPTRQYPVTWRLAFLEAERGKSPLMDCTWFVWVRGEKPLDRPLKRPEVGRVPSTTKKPVTVHLRRLEAAFAALEEAIDGWREQT